MTYSLTTLTLSQLLTSDDATIYRNALSILKTLRECDHHYEEGKCMYCLKPKPQAGRPAQWCGTCGLPADQCKNDHD